ncbi:MAG: DUF3006 domain-containing protein [Clostridia bacterium]|nr:DUF3006 domain-containing protein [Clostridia bacterium]
MQRLSIDRIESNFAVCEKDDGTMLNILLDELPSNVQEGNILLIDDKGKIKLDEQAEKARKSELLNLQNSLFDK